MKQFSTNFLFALSASAILLASSTGLRAAEPRPTTTTMNSTSRTAAVSRTSHGKAKVASRQSIMDVSLMPGGKLDGFLVDEQGRPLQKSDVIVRQGRRVLGRTLTGAKGEFTFKGLRGGIYEVVSDRGQQVFRLWTPGTAPKSSRGTALIVARSQVVRGQFGDFGGSTLSALGDLGTLSGMGTAGTVATVGVVAGVTVGAVVIAEEANDDDPPPAAMSGAMMTNGG